MARQILALDPYHTGSHAAFINGWIAHSRHTWTLRTLPGRRWKWRMRHAAETFGHGLHTEPPATRPDLIVTTDMLNVAELRAFLPRSLRDLPVLLYAHESQFTYPTQQQDERDLHFAATNLYSALNADAVWFNSAFHRDAFVDASGAFARRMPDHPPADLDERLRSRLDVQHPGVAIPETPRTTRIAGPLRILWNARWEHDKAPECFFDALDRLASTGAEFTVDLLGERFEQTPACFDEAPDRLAGHLRHIGHLPRAEYDQALADADVVCSTARHEFFGIALLEAVGAGALPLTPNALAYPETLAGLYTHHDPFHAGNAAPLADRLATLAATIDDPAIDADRRRGTRIARDRYAWSVRAGEMDHALDRIIRIMAGRA